MIPSPARAAARLPGLDLLRGLASLGVVLFHYSGAAFGNSFGAEPAVGPLFRFGYAGLDLFFVLSGFIICLVHRGDLGRPDRLPSFVGKRLLRIFPAYWVVLLVYTVLAEATHVPLGEPRILASTFLIPVGQPVLAVAWTLSHEMLFYALFALAIVAPRLGVAVGAAWFAGSVLLIGQMGALGFLFSARHLEFLLGIVAALLLSSGREVQGGPLLAAGMAVFAMAAVVDDGAWAVPEWLPVTAYALGSFGIILGTAALDLAGGLRVPRAMVLLGQASYALYLTHLLTFSVATRVLQALHVPALLPGWALLTLLVLAAVAVGIGFHLVVERPLLALRRRPARAFTAMAEPL